MPIELASRAIQVDWDDSAGNRVQVARVEQRASDALDRARRFIDVPAWSSGQGGEHLDGLAEILDQAVESVLEVLRIGNGATHETMHELCTLAVGLQRLRSEQQELLVSARMRAVASTRRALDSTAGDGDVDSLLHRAGIEVCRATGMDRSMVFRVDGHRLEPVSSHFVGHDEWAQVCQEHAEAHPIDLRTPELLEGEMVRRRAAALVSEPMDDPRAFQPIVQKISTPGYIAVPVLVDGTPVATVHADRYFQGRQVDVIDRDAVAGFAAGLAYVLERSVLLDRLRAQRRAALELLQMTEATVDEFRAGELRSTPRRDADAAPRAAPSGGSRVLPSAGPRVDWLDSLTRREHDVLRLMVTGATNAAIARKLVVTEGTVKSHVKRLLRKTGTARRAEVVAMYHRTVRQ